MKKIIIMFCAIVLICCSCVSVSAHEPDKNFEITPIQLSADEESDYLRRFAVDVLDNNSNIYKDRFIYSFDVSESGKCAIFFDNAAILILQSDGTVERILKFKNDVLNTKMPSKVLIQWKEEGFDVIFGYGVVCSFSINGELLDTLKYESERTSLPTKTVIENGNNIYEMKYTSPFVHFFGGNRYDKLVKKDSSSKETILFDSEKSLPNITIFVFIFILAFNAFAIFIIIKVVLMRKRAAITR